ncbi:eCIS core domain-containing protein [Flavilitoribacter nigricans]|uniref:eCIS core domain-containing protein n=1 Tax=Flavilitoribacter nigricans (strain ATCC 23147 / DSM 23189 / NBRC 102662 / NCIMB 1420 / SS-2) TaxID=1122177 RepID=A0A2D0N258_FLAN2|nr:DUF4157 domain-containing protein [Flavilitoribacter nigricans]PHN02209.1 hypothetical protein CRP01_33280 [Flavilitoribacter nigricans DSM 23189 = NBRC 102662]
MNTRADKKQENKSHSAASAVSEKQGSSESTFQFADNRPEVVAQRKLQDMANSSLQANQIAQLQAMTNNHSAQGQQPIQKKENNTGLPDNLKMGMENLSGYSMDNVKVYYNSDKSAQLQAHAYAQGTDIHLGSGQEKHLPHEAWHVVQQKQGRVSPTMQMEGGVNVNDDKRLEKEGDTMGVKALQMKENNSRAAANSVAQKKSTVKQGFGFVDNRSEAISQRKLHSQANCFTRDCGRLGRGNTKTFEQDNSQNSTLQRKIIIADGYVASEEDANGDEDKKLVIDELIKNEMEYKFSTYRGYIADVVMRAEMIKGMRFLNSDISPFRYNWESDHLKMPSEWVGVDHKSNDPGDDGKGSAFIPAEGRTSLEAVESIFRAAGSEKYYLDCSTAILAVQYKALLAAYTELENANTFNRAEGRDMALAPEGVTKVKFKHGFKDTPGDELKEEITLKNQDHLAPGDSVYFKNYSDYETTHEGPEAAWAGEHAVYIGNGRFSGFGANDLSYDDMVQTLVKAYNEQGRNSKWKKKDEPEDYGPSISGTLPGMLKTVNRLRPPKGLE